MDRTSEVSTTAELSILYEILLLQFSKLEGSFAKEVIEKAVRLFGVRRLALLVGEGNSQRLIASLAFRNEEEIANRIGENKPNQFKFDFGSDDKLGTLFMEKANTIETKERRLYSIFARQLENGLIVAREAAERKQAEEALRESEEKFRTFMETASDLMNITDKDGKFTYVNDSMARTLGYSKEELIGMHITQILTKEALEKDFKPNWDKFTTNGEISLETTFLTKEGKEICCEIKAVTVYDSDGNYVGSRAVHHDITQRKRWEREQQEKNEQLDAQNEELQAAEEELRSSNEELEAAKEELEDRVKERTAELVAANEELREAQEQLIRSEKLGAIGQLAGGVGHELRNPLGAIKNAVYYVKGKVANSELAQKEPRVMQFLEIADDEVNSSNKIISDLLGFSRVGKPAISPTRVKKMIEDALSRTTFPENIELTKRLDTDLTEIEVDSDQLQQVLVNIITNAVQAMPEGGKLTIGTREKGKFLEVEITDTGSGIPEEVRDKIFEPLFTTKAKGIGLGLAVCKSIIDRHGGHIAVKSKVGEGTTFNIKLPLKAA